MSEISKCPVCLESHTVHSKDIDSLWSQLLCKSHRDGLAISEIYLIGVNKQDLEGREEGEIVDSIATTPTPLAVVKVDRDSVKQLLDVKSARLPCYVYVDINVLEYMSERCLEVAGDFLWSQQNAPSTQAVN